MRRGRSKMRNPGKAILAAMMLLLAPVALAPAAVAQDTSPAQNTPPAESAPAAAVPKRPIPSTRLRPAPAAPAPAAAIPRQPNGARQAVGQALDPAELEAFMDGWIANAMAREHVPGATISVVQNGQVILKKGYGFADLANRRRVDPDRSLFRLGSVSKTFTWILLMKEVEAGRIRLDRPINLYLPEKVRLPGKGGEIMVRNLMDHSAGFEDRALGQLFENDPRRVRPLDLYLRQERPDRVRAPGVLSSYSNYGVGLAGAATAFVSRKTFERRVEDLITGPLGMNHTTFREPRPERRGLPGAMPARLRGDVATGYGWRAAGFMADDYEYIGHIAPAGSASSTAGDMSRFMLMLLGDGAWNGTTVFGPQTARAFRSPIQKTPPGINGWAHGFIMMDLPGGRRGYGHLGHTIAFHTNMTLVPELGLGVFISTNGERGGKLSDVLPAAVVRHFYTAPPIFPRPGSRDLVEAGEIFEGDYISTRRAHGGLEAFVHLLQGQAEVDVTSGGRLVVARNGESMAFVPEGPVSEGRFISTVGEERIAFRMRDGHPVSFRSGPNIETLERAAFGERVSTLIAGAVLTLLAAVATLVGLAVRNRRDLRQNQMQARASLVQTIQAGLWIAAIGLFALWGAGASDVQAIMYRWPGPLVVTASACALVAAALTLVTIVATPAIWQGGRRVDSWPVLRKVSFTLTVLIYAGFSVLLALGGALEPWSG
ncbi:serine hydrolase [uncultured Phenylobacterium sp.]|uniref:serine hydrolase domain-containing protein n=1 Tax=uncultured Phenylobacterium sp. TaxID=349273 RepID=UPI0025CDFA26|nr:serine hydrolase domain-containing protein [uncultured Phenylobacterium sp.]